MQKLEIADLLKTIKPSGNTESTENVSKKVSKATEEYLTSDKMKVKKIRKSDEMLMKRKQNYRATQEDMDKWLGIVKINREKETLDLTEKNKDGASKVNFFPSKPISELQDKTEKVLKKLSLQNQSTVMKSEEKQLNKLDPEQAKRRLLQARKHRTTVFYQEQKNRRIGKIKSKLYHKIKKRQKLREEAKRVETMDAHEKNEYFDKLTSKRIKERISLRHNTKSKHIQNLLRFNKYNKDSVQEAMNEVNAIRRKQLQKNEDQIEALGDLSQEYDDENYRQQAIEDLERELNQMEQESSQGDAVESGKQKGLDGMKFMKVANEKKQKKEMDDAYRLLNQLNNQEDSDNIDFGSEDEMSEENEGEERTRGQEEFGEVTRRTYGKDNDSGNLVQSSENKKSHIKSNISKTLMNGENKLSESDLIKGINVENLKEKYQPKRADLKLNEELLHQNQELFNQTQNQAALQNLREFQEEKLGDYQSQIEPEKKKVQGWGSWAGPNIQPKKIDPEAQIKRKIAKIEQIKRKRRDGDMSSVVINEVRNKNLKDYFVKKLPHQYNNAEQFEYMNKQSMGPEWNSLTQFKSNIQPKVTSKVGQVIEPIRMPKKITKLENRI